MNAKNPWPLAALISCLLACGGAGPPGPAGPAGTPGSNGSNGSNGSPGAGGGGLVWKDATGAVAGYDSDIGPVYLDEAQGVTWVLDIQTAKPAAHATNQVQSLYYVASNCTGTPLVVPFPAGVVFRAQGDTVFHVQPTTLAGTQVTSGSAGLSGSCLTSTIQSIMVPVASTVPATALVEPTLPFSPPLHLAKP